MTSEEGAAQAQVDSTQSKTNQKASKGISDFTAEPQRPSPCPTQGCPVPCQECAERLKRTTSGRATTQTLPMCGMDHSSVEHRSASEFLWHSCPTCCSGVARGLLNDIDATLRDLSLFKAEIDSSVGQEARIAIKRSLQNVDQEWLITILRKMVETRVSRNISNPWCAFESVIAEPPFYVGNT